MQLICPKKGMVIDHALSKALTNVGQCVNKIRLELYLVANCIGNRTGSNMPSQLVAIIGFHSLSTAEHAVKGKFRSCVTTYPYTVALPHSVSSSHIFSSPTFSIQFTMVCRNLCERLYSQIIFGKSHYEGGKKYCRRCEVYFCHNGFFCPCCGTALRVSPTRKRDKARLRQLHLRREEQAQSRAGHAAEKSARLGPVA